jgi:FixJ family two-component response regulator
MPGMSGPELQQELTLRGHAIAIIFITARVDQTVRRQLIARGAVDCLLKPFSEQQLKTALEAALPGSRAG